MKVTGAAALAFYFVSSIFLTVFNKWFFSQSPHSVAPSSAESPQIAAFVATTSLVASSALTNCTVQKMVGARNAFRSPYNFHFPLSTTCIHQFVVWLLLLLCEKRVLVPIGGEINRSSALFRTIVPIGLLCGIDWGLSNTSLRFVDLSLYEMMKSSSPMFVLLFSVLLGMMKPSLFMLGVVCLLSVGMFLSVSGGDLAFLSVEHFPVVGFAQLCIATLLSGTRVVLLQALLQHGSVSNAVAHSQQLPSSPTAEASCTKPSINPPTMLYYAAPASAAALLAPALLWEGMDVVHYFRTVPTQMSVEVATWIGGTSLLAFFLSMSELLATRYTSALTLCVVGISKQVFIVVVALTVFSETVHSANVVGFVLTFLGIVLYNFDRIFGRSPTAFTQCSSVSGSPLVRQASSRGPTSAPEFSDRRL